MQAHSLHYAMLLLLAVVAQTAALSCEWLHDVRTESSLTLPSGKLFIALTFLNDFRLGNSGYHVEALFKASVSSARRFYNCTLQLYWPLPYGAYVDVDGCV